MPHWCEGIGPVADPSTVLVALQESVVAQEVLQFGAEGLDQSQHKCQAKRAGHFVGHVEFLPLGGSQLGGIQTRIRSCVDKQDVSCLLSQERQKALVSALVSQCELRHCLDEILGRWIDRGGSLSRDLLFLGLAPGRPGSLSSPASLVLCSWVLGPATVLILCPALPFLHLVPFRHCCCQSPADIAPAGFATDNRLSPRSPSPPPLQSRPSAGRPRPSSTLESLLDALCCCSRQRCASDAW